MGKQGMVKLGIILQGSLYNKENKWIMSTNK